MASFPRPGGFGSSWASCPSGARMGLVSSSDMAATEVKYQCKWGESRIQTGREYIQSMRNPSLIPQPALLFCYSFYAFTLAILQTFSAQLQGWPETACLVHSLGITSSTMPRLSEIHCSDSKDLCWPIIGHNADIRSTIFMFLTAEHEPLIFRRLTRTKD